MSIIVSHVDPMTALAVTVAILIMWPFIVGTVIKALRVMTQREF